LLKHSSFGGFRFSPYPFLLSDARLGFRILTGIFFLRRLHLPLVFFFFCFLRMSGSFFPLTSWVFWRFFSLWLAGGGRVEATSFSCCSLIPPSVNGAPTQLLVCPLRKALPLPLFLPVFLGLVWPSISFFFFFFFFFLFFFFFCAIPFCGVFSGRSYSSGCLIPFFFSFFFFPL